ncbi:MAG: glycosyltransferase [Candidatus Omnitrophica bacterium]|nr:glycosyltransferase [Candidatus Omnitrophota bacterium]
MKIFVTYVSAGSGHKKIAESIADHFKHDFPQYDIRILDALTYTNTILKKIYSGVYDFLVKYAKWLWSVCFWLTDVTWLYPLSRTLMFISHRLTTQGFANLLLKEQPDIVISTHFLPSEIVSYLKDKNRLQSSLVTVITDFGAHSYWIQNRTGLYCVASTATKEILISKGVADNRISVTGLPIDEKFSAAYDRSKVRVKLQLEDNRFTALIMTGSFGIGPIEEIVTCLQGKVRFLVVCARNDLLFKRLNMLNLPDVLVFGFIDYVYELMAVSDVIITKPGGSTISEILAFELPPIFISAIPGQEYENARVLNEYKIGVTPRSVNELAEIILDYKSHPEKIAAVKASMKKVFIPHADSELVNAIRKSGIRASA